MICKSSAINFRFRQVESNLLQSCAATLAQHPSEFKVTIIERLGVTGGQATSIALDESQYGTDWMNK